MIFQLNHFHTFYAVVAYLKLNLLIEHVTTSVGLNNCYSASELLSPKEGRQMQSSSHFVCQLGTDRTSR